MSTQDLKDRLHRQIETADNEELLRWVSEVLDGTNPTQGKYQLSENEKSILAERDVVKEPGNYYTTEQLEQCLKVYLPLLNQKLYYQPCQYANTNRL